MLEMQDKLQEELETAGLNSGSYPALPGIIDDPGVTSQNFVGDISWKGGSGGDCKSMDKSDDEDSVGGGSGGDDDDEEEDEDEDEDDDEEEELRVCMFPSGVGVVRTVFRPNADGRFATAVAPSQHSTAQQQPPSPLLPSVSVAAAEAGLVDFQTQRGRGVSSFPITSPIMIEQGSLEEEGEDDRERDDGGVFIQQQQQQQQYSAWPANSTPPMASPFRPSTQRSSPSNMFQSRHDSSVRIENNDEPPGYKNILSTPGSSGGSGSSGPVVHGLVVATERMWPS